MNLSQQQNYDTAFETKMITGGIMVFCSCLFGLICGVFFPGLVSREMALIFPVASLAILAGVYLKRNSWFLYILLSLVSNWFVFVFIRFSYIDCFVYNGGDHGQTTVWFLLFFGIPLLVGVVVGIVGNILVFRNRKLLPRAKNNMSAPMVSSPVKSTNTITPLLGAIINGDADLVRTALQDHPEHLNTAYAQNGNTPLHVAALNGKTEIVKFLLAQPGIDKTLKNNDGKTAADLAQAKGFTEIVMLLN